MFSDKCKAMVFVTCNHDCNCFILDTYPILNISIYSCFNWIITMGRRRKFTCYYPSRECFNSNVFFKQFEFFPVKRGLKISTSGGISKEDI